MKNPVYFAFVAAVVLDVLCVSALAQTVQVGSVAPDFTVVNHATGAPIRLRDFAGTIVVLDFFAYWCGPCQVSSPMVEKDIQKYYTGRGGNATGVPVVVLAVEVDQTDKTKTDTFIRNAGLELAADDTSGQASLQYGVYSIPTFAVINGVSGAAGTAQWQVLFRQAGYGNSLDELRERLRQAIETVKAPPRKEVSITIQPRSQSVLPGQTASLSVEVTGWPTPSLQWRRDGVVISGATSNTLYFAAATVKDAGKYSVTASNSLGNVTSETVQLKVVNAVVSPDSKELGSGRAVYQAQVTSNSTWTASKEAAWVSLSKTSGGREDNLEITVEANPGTADRLATVMIGDNAHTITQRGTGAALRELWSMGGDTYGQLGDNRLLQRLSPVSIAGEVKHAAAGSTHSLFVKTDGSLWAVGDNTSGQLGDGSTTNRSTPVQVATGVQAVAAGSSHSLFLKTDGSLWAMGYGSSGRLGDGSATTQTRPVQVATGVQTVAAGGSHSFFLKTDGSLWAMGYNYYGQLGDGSTTDRITPVQVTTGVQMVAAGSIHSLFLKTDGSLWAMGYNATGCLGDGSATKRTAPVQVATGIRAVAAGAGAYHSLFVKTDGSLWAMGFNQNGQLGDGSNNDRRSPVQVGSAVQAVAAGAYHSLFVKADGSLWVMGQNTSDQLGDGSTTNRSTPVQVVSGVRVIAAGAFHCLFVKVDGSLWAMGQNPYGELGVAATTGISTPTHIASDVREVAAGANHSLFVRTDGTLWATGRNSVGQLGDGATTSRTAPVQVTTGVYAAAAGAYHSLFVKTDGSLWTMGNNPFGQLGDGSNNNRDVPVQVSAGVRAATAGTHHSLFVKTDGSLWAMGLNNFGQLGDGSTTNRSTPVQVATSVYTAIAGSYHSLFVKTDGSLWAMGSNSVGQLGDGGTATRTIPVQIATGVQAVAAGSYHSLFIKADGSLWAMGQNTSGQLGDGSTIYRRTPVKVADNVATVAAGGDFTLFVTEPGARLNAPQIVTQPVTKTAAPGESVSLSVAAESSGPFSCQWRRNGVNISGATGTTLTLNNVGYAEVGSYEVVVTNGAGTSTSQAALLTVGTSRISNLSVRTNLAAGQTLFVGFVTTGAKPLLVRGVGPGMHSVFPQFFGPADVFADPRLELYNTGSAKVDENDNWNSTHAPILTAVGAFPLVAGSRDAALVANVDGGYTAQLKGTGTGVVLVDAYDTTSSFSPRLKNVSARNQVGTGPNILIAGFVIEGTGGKALLIRGIGPALRDIWGITSALVDPKLELYDSDNRKIYENDNWSATLTPTFDQVGAYRFTAGSRDAALLVSLPPGIYSAQVSGVGGTTGEGVIEVYELQ